MGVVVGGSPKFVGPSGPPSDPPPDPPPPPPPDPEPPTPDRTPTLVATSTAAAAQGSDVGKELHRLTVWNGRLYAAYGDYGVNTGPIDVISLDLADTGAGFAAEATLHTEETWLFRAAGDRLYVAFIDPQGYGDGSTGQVAYATAPDSWTVIDNVSPVPIHVMGVCETVDGIFLFGMAEDGGPPADAIVYRSTDDGATWGTSLAPHPTPGTGHGLYTPMLYPAGVIEALIETDSTVLYRWESGAWSTVTDPYEGTGHVVSDAVAFTYQGTPFQFCIDHGKQYGYVQDSTWHIRTQLADADLIDEITATIPAGRYRDACTDGTHLWLLDRNGTIHKGDTSGTWTTVCTLDLIPSSITVDGSTLYLGTSDSKVYSTPA